jgi:hypothetical protein
MANTLFFFMAPEDEVAFLRMLERYTYEIYPRRIPPDWTTFRAAADIHDKLPEDDLYLHAAPHGDALVSPIRRGADKGMLRIDEVRSPVIHMQRSMLNEEGELLSGGLWAELDVTPETGRRTAAPHRFAAEYVEIETWVKKTFRRSDPKDYWIGPRAARRVKEENLVLRINEHRGGTVKLHRGR